MLDKLRFSVPVATMTPSPLSGSSVSESSLPSLLSTSVLHLNVLRHHTHVTADKLLIKNGRWHLEKEREKKKAAASYSEE